MLIARKVFSPPFCKASLFRSPFTKQFSRMAPTKSLPKLPIFEAIAGHDPNSTAVVHSASGRSFTYGELLRDVADAKNTILKETGDSSIAGHRVAFLVENSYDYVGAQE
jgi:malonyl-CoA/methylmalonyl-CoA synthetase